MVARRMVLGGFGATALTGAFASTIAAAAATMASGERNGRVPGRLQAAYAGLFEAALAASPETATLEGLDGQGGLKHRLDDRSLGNRLSIYSPLVAAHQVLADQPLPVKVVPADAVGDRV